MSTSLLHLYYQYYFPTTLLFQWMKESAAKAGKEPHHREWSCRFVGMEAGAPLRYIPFLKEESLRSFLLMKTPLRLDVGAICKSSMVEHREARQLVTRIGKRKKKNAQAPTLKMPDFPPIVYKELVFDVDMEDYDKGVKARRCCGQDPTFEPLREEKEKEEEREVHEAPKPTLPICERCWPLLAIAATLIRFTLTEKWGFKHLLCVYSGRRGLHVWVRDAEAATLCKTTRQRLVEDTLTMFYASSHEENKSILESYVYPLFLKFMKLQDYESSSKPLYSALYNELERTRGDPSQVTPDCWTQILSLVSPRIDEGVTSRMDHLLKIPFSVHPSTQRVSIPLAFDKLATLNPLETPLVHELPHPLFKEGLAHFKEWLA